MSAFLLGPLDKLPGQQKASLRGTVFADPNLWGVSDPATCLPMVHIEGRVLSKAYGVLLCSGRSTDPKQHCACAPMMSTLARPNPNSSACEPANNKHAHTTHTQHLPMKSTPARLYRHIELVTPRTQFVGGVGSRVLSKRSLRIGVGPFLGASVQFQCN